MLVAHISKLRGESTARYYIRASFGVFLLALLMASCGGTPTPEKSGDSAVGDLLKTLDEILVKVQGREEAFADAGNTRGAQLMSEAADNVKDMQTAVRALADEVPPSPEGTSTMEETTATPKQREVFNRLLENRRQLEEKIEEAQECCGLPPSFLDEELRRLDAEIKALRAQLGLEHDGLEETTRSAREQYEREEITGGSPEEPTSATSTSEP